MAYTLTLLAHLDTSISQFLHIPKYLHTCYISISLGTCLRVNAISVPPYMRIVTSLLEISSHIHVPTSHQVLHTFTSTCLRVNEPSIPSHLLASTRPQVFHTFTSTRTHQSTNPSYLHLHAPTSYKPSKSPHIHATMHPQSPPNLHMLETTSSQFLHTFKPTRNHTSKSLPYLHIYTEPRVYKFSIPSHLLAPTSSQIPKLSHLQAPTRQ